MEDSSSPQGAPFHMDNLSQHSPHQAKSDETKGIAKGLLW